MTAGTPRPHDRLLGPVLLIALGLALLAQTTGVIPAAAANWTGAAVLAAIGLMFLVLYLAERARWWALVPAGTLVTLAGVTAAAPVLPDSVSGAALLFGLAGTFALVAVAPGPARPRAWAWLPAAILATLGAITLGSLDGAMFWPLALILLGIYLVARWAARGRQPGA